MSTFGTASPQPSNTPFEHREPPSPSEFKRPPARALVAAGDPKTGKRVELCSTCWRNHRLASGAIHAENLNPCHEYTLCENCANLRAEDLISRYSVLTRVCPSQFIYIETSSMDTYPAIYRALRHKLMGKIKILANPGWCARRKQLIYRIAILAPIYSIGYIVNQALHTADPAIDIHPYGSHSLIPILNRMFTSLLPPDMPNRLILKYIKRKVIFVGATQDERKKLFDKDSKPPSNKNFQDTSAERPCTIHGCVAHTETYRTGEDKSQLTYHYHSGPPPDRPPRTLCGEIYA